MRRVAVKGFYGLTKNLCKSPLSTVADIILLNASITTTNNNGNNGSSSQSTRTTKKSRRRTINKNGEPYQEIQCDI